MKLKVNSEQIAIGGVIAAMYVVLTLAFMPISFGPLQFRLGGLVKPIALVSPVFACALAVGTFVANLASPFGLLDWGTMPVVELLAGLACYGLRKRPIIALAAQAAIIGAGVAIFPLGLGLGAPLAPTWASVFITQLVLALMGYLLIWQHQDVSILAQP